MEEPTKKRYLTAGEASEITGFKPNTLSIMARQGRIPAIKIGSRWRFPDDELASWVESKRDGDHHEQ